MYISCRCWHHRDAVGWDPQFNLSVILKSDHVTSSVIPARQPTANGFQPTTGSRHFGWVSKWQSWKTSINIYHKIKLVIAKYQWYFNISKSGSKCKPVNMHLIFIGCAQWVDHNISSTILTCSWAISQNKFHCLQWCSDNSFQQRILVTAPLNL